MEEPLVRCQLQGKKIQLGFGPLVEGFHYAIYNDLESVKQLVTENTAAVMLELVQGGEVSFRLTRILLRN